MRRSSTRPSKKKKSERGYPPDSEGRKHEDPVHAADVTLASFAPSMLPSNDRNPTMRDAKDAEDPFGDRSGYSKYENAQPMHVDHFEMEDFSYKSKG